MGGKYGKQHRERERRDTRESLATFDVSAAWSPDPQEPTVEEQETNFISDTVLIAQRTVRYVRNDSIVEFAVVVQEQVGQDQWREVLCIDTCNHGTVHRHRDGDHTRLEDLAPITDQGVVQDGYWEAVGEAYDLVYNEGATP